MGALAVVAVFVVAVVVAVAAVVAYVRPSASVWNRCVGAGAGRERVAPPSSSTWPAGKLMRMEPARLTRTVVPGDPVTTNSRAPLLSAVSRATRGAVLRYCGATPTGAGSDVRGYAAWCNAARICMGFRPQHGHMGEGTTH